jgi:hypothetical protein
VNGGLGSAVDRQPYNSQEMSTIDSSSAGVGGVRGPGRHLERRGLADSQWLVWHSEGVDMRSLTTKGQTDQ